MHIMCFNEPNCISDCQPYYYTTTKEYYYENQDEEEEEEYYYYNGITRYVTMTSLLYVIQIQKYTII